MNDTIGSLLKKRKILRLIIEFALILSIIINAVLGYLFVNKTKEYKSQQEIVNNKLNCPICPLKVKYSEVNPVVATPVAATPTPIVETPTPVAVTATPSISKTATPKATVKKTATPVAATPTPAPTADTSEEVIAPPPPPS